MKNTNVKMIREPAEIRFKADLDYLKEKDDRPKPENWILSPKSVEEYILGSDAITQKFYGDKILVQRAIATIASNKALIFIGEPGTAKSWLSEHLAAAISGYSLNVIQGSSGTLDDQIKYSFNYAILLAKGPCKEALVLGPIYRGMERGQIVRFEEITRCSQEVQDGILGILSEKMLLIPELSPPDDILFAQPGFNIIATANTRDRGVNEMSSAMKRRFNFETISPIQEIDEEIALVSNQTKEILERSGVNIEPRDDIIELLVTTFQELRNGETKEGEKLQRPNAIMSTAECVDTSVNTLLYAHYFEEKNKPKAAVLNLISTVLKDDQDDLQRLRNYFDIIVKKRVNKNRLWKAYFESRRYLG